MTELTNAISGMLGRLAELRAVVGETGMADARLINASLAKAEANLANALSLAQSRDDDSPLVREMRRAERAGDHELVERLLRRAEANGLARAGVGGLVPVDQTIAETKEIAR